jgi:hypothetical protein
VVIGAGCNKGLATSERSLTLSPGSLLWCVQNGRGYRSCVGY